ncbi:MAG: hypothetical protein XD50_1053 [Clostridia bacterium 41_269]|nr:MAG: hypothetical protein XD50_1053 [Clostridia bacterium 41_269]
MLDENLIWFVIFLFLSIVSIVVVPREELYKLLPLGIVASFLLPMLILVFFSTITGSVAV